MTAIIFSLPSASIAVVRTTELSTPPEKEIIIGPSTLLNHSISLLNFPLTHHQVLSN